MSFFSQIGQGGPLGFGQTSTDTSLATLVGAKFTTADNAREFALIQNAGVALVAARVVQGPVNIGANHQNLATSTAAIGATSVTVTLGGTAATLNQYAGGFVYFNAGTGIGQTLGILSHPAQTSTSGTVVLTLSDPIAVATLSSDTKSSLSLPKYGSANGVDVRTSGCVVCPTTLTGPVLGITNLPIPASTSTVPSYGFIQTRGPVAVLNDSTTAIGLDIMPSASVAGAVVTYVAATSSRIGTSTVAGVTTESRLVTVQL